MKVQIAVHTWLATYLKALRDNGMITKEKEFNLVKEALYDFAIQVDKTHKLVKK